MKKLMLALISLFLVIPCQGRTITVDDDGPADFNNIQAAINDANDGDTIIVADGTYTGPGNRRINFGGRAITLCSEGGPENCIIDCEDLGRGFIFHSGEDENSVVIGFTITHGVQWCDPCLGCPITWYGGGISCKYSSPTIRECIISDNYAHLGGGISIWDGAPKVINCVITNNEAMDGGGGIYCGPGDVSVVNCTIAENLAGYYGGGLFCTDEATVVSSILWGNTPDQIENWGSVTAFLNDIEGGWSGGINVDPCFANPVNRDYHLKSEAGRWDPNENRWVADTNTSPCIDFGYDGFYPGLDYKSELWPHGKWINMGAYGGTPQASMSLSGAGNIADLDNDDDVDYADMGVFVDEWLSQEVLLSEDLDRNGFVDFNDFGTFAGNWRWVE